MDRKTLNLLLSFVSGYVDAAVFVHMGGLFVAHVTGNFVLLGVTLHRFVSGGVDPGQHGQIAVLQLASFPLFFVAAMLAAAINDRVGAPASGTRRLLAIATSIFVLVASAPLLFAGGDSALALALVVAMALLNAAHRLDPSIGPPFTVMTGNVTAVAVVAARALMGAGAAPALALSAVPVLGFLFGCLVGAASQGWFGFTAMAVPTVALVAATVLAGPPAAKSQA